LISVSRAFNILGQGVSASKRKKEEKINKIIHHRKGSAHLFHHLQWILATPELCGASEIVNQKVSTIVKEGQRLSINRWRVGAVIR